MTLRSRFTLTAVIVLGMFSLNVLTYFWASHQRQTGLVELSGYIDSQQLSSNLRERLRDTHNSIRFYNGNPSRPMSKATRKQILADLKATEYGFQQLRKQIPPELGSSGNKVVTQSTMLINAWRAFTQDQTERPLASAQLREDETRYRNILRLLVTIEKQAAHGAHTRSLAINDAFLTTDLATALITIASIFVVCGSSIQLTRHTNRALNKLRTGAQRIGDGELAHRIELNGNDELTAVAEAVNGMAAELTQALKNSELARDKADLAHESKSRFIAKVSHELRTPLSSILGYSELLDAELALVDLPQRKAMQADLAQIEGAGRHLLELINDVLDLSKAESGKAAAHLGEIDGPTLVDDIASTVRPIISRNNNTLLLEIPDGNWHVYSDETRLRQIILNLLSNAARFTVNGTVKLRIKQQPDKLQVEVHDTGIGISDARLEKIFEPFEQASAQTAACYGGTGLGLAICREYAELLGGSIYASSEEGYGSRFTLELPSRALEG